MYATGTPTTQISVQKPMLARFGAAGAASLQIYRLVGPDTGSFTCSPSSFFGVDPAPGLAHYCWAAPLDGTARANGLRADGSR
jgi:hypothetical protein